MCWQEQWLKGLYGNRDQKDSLETLVKLPHVLPLIFLVSRLWKILSHLLYSVLLLLFTYFRICQTVKKMERDRTSWGGGKRFWNKKNIFFLSVVTRAYASSPECSQAPRGILDQGFLAQTRFQETEVPLSHTLEAENKPKQLGEWEQGSGFRTFCVT